jgi:hypothetical protein
MATANAGETATLELTRATTLQEVGRRGGLRRAEFIEGDPRSIAAKLILN